jgi:uncharacterized membrane protein YccC
MVSWGFHANSFRYALALWLATMLALLISFVVQLEPAQWSAITVWIIFIQNPRMNYSKIIWWAFGTIMGAFVAILLTVFFSQAPELLILFLALWLAVCSGAAPLLSNYRAYGAVLAGYTCAIVSMSAVEHPDLIFNLAVTRVSCIFIGMASAIFMITILLPKHRHWRETRHHLTQHLKATLRRAAMALEADATQPAQFTWRHMVDRLSTLEHTLDITTAESADARIYALPARSLVATLFDLLAKAQSVEVHLSRSGTPVSAGEIKILLQRAKKLLTDLSEGISDKLGNSFGSSLATDLKNEIENLRNASVGARQTLLSQTTETMLSNRFLLDRLDEILAEADEAIQDWAGLFGSWTAQRPSRLAVHRDYRSAFIYGLRMFLTINLAGMLWLVTQWPSGATFVMFIAVVCSLLSLVDYAPQMGMPFLKSAAFCAIMAYVEAFWLLQKSEGFVVLFLMFGIFLLPAAYFYRHPRLIGGAVVSMLVFYGLTNPSNQMTYDIATFLNNAIAFLSAAACGFFMFHAVPSLDAKARQFWLLHAVRSDLARSGRAQGVLSEQSWTSRMFDRIRLLHRAAGGQPGTPDWLETENEMLISLQLGLRQRGLNAQLKRGGMTPDAAMVVDDVLNEFQEISRHPSILALFLRSACIRFEEAIGPGGKNSDSTLGALAEMWEMTRLLETTTRFYAD